MRQYGGQQLTTGAQAEVYADHFIANHLKAAGRPGLSGIWTIQAPDGSW
jgi:hypothetical protein